MSNLLVEVCNANPAFQEELENLEHTYPGLVLLENDCQSQCELCASSCYVYFNGDIVYADDFPTMLQLLELTIYRAITEMETSE